MGIQPWATSQQQCHLLQHRSMTSSTHSQLCQALHDKGRVQKATAEVSFLCRCIDKLSKQPSKRQISKSQPLQEQDRGCEVQGSRYGNYWHQPITSRDASQHRQARSETYNLSGTLTTWARFLCRCTDKLQPMAGPPELRPRLQATAAVANIIINRWHQSPAVSTVRQLWNASNLRTVLCRCAGKLSKQPDERQPLEERDRSCELQGGSGGHRKGVPELQRPAGGGQQSHRAPAATPGTHLCQTGQCCYDHTFVSFFLQNMPDVVRRFTELQQPHLACVFVRQVNITILHAFVFNICMNNTWMQYWSSWWQDMFVRQVSIPMFFCSCEMDVSLKILDVSESQGAFVSCDMSTFMNIWW